MEILFTAYARDGALIQVIDFGNSFDVWETYLDEEPIGHSLGSFPDFDTARMVAGWWLN